MPTSTKNNARGISPGVFAFSKCGRTLKRTLLVDIVLLPVEGGVGLNDDVFVRVLLEFVDEHGFARFERFGDFRVDAQGQIGIIPFGGDGHLARFGLNFVAERRDGLDHSGAAA